MDRLQALKTLGQEWQKSDDFHRIYFNDLGARLGVETSRYNTGNIMSARQDGQKISNSEAKRILSRCNCSKLWYDVQTGQFQTRGELREAEVARIIESIEAEIQVLTSQ